MLEHESGTHRKTRMCEGAPNLDLGQQVCPLPKPMWGTKTHIISKMLSAGYGPSPVQLVWIKRNRP